LLARERAKSALARPPKQAIWMNIVDAGERGGGVLQPLEARMDFSYTL